MVNPRGFVENHTKAVAASPGSPLEAPAWGRRSESHCTVVAGSGELARTHSARSSQLIYQAASHVWTSLKNAFSSSSLPDRAKARASQGRVGHLWARCGIDVADRRGLYPMLPPSPSAQLRQAGLLPAHQCRLRTVGRRRLGRR